MAFREGFRTWNILGRLRCGRSTESCKSHCEQSKSRMLSEGKLIAAEDQQLRGLCLRCLIPTPEKNVCRIQVRCFNGLDESIWRKPCSVFEVKHMHGQTSASARHVGLSWENKQLRTVTRNGVAVRVTCSMIQMCEASEQNYFSAKHR